MYRAFVFVATFSGLSVAGGFALSLANRHYVELEHHAALSDVSTFEGAQVEVAALGQSPDIARLVDALPREGISGRETLSAPSVDENLKTQDVTLAPLGSAPDASPRPAARGGEEVARTAPNQRRFDTDDEEDFLTVAAPRPAITKRAPTRTAAVVTRSGTQGRTATDKVTPRYLIGVYR